MLFSKMKSFAPITLVAALGLLAGFTSVNAAPMDVFIPPILTPVENDVWVVGSTQVVTWDISRPPRHITNKKGKVVLAKGGYLDYEHPIAENFDIMDGRVEVIVPNVNEEANDYQIVLFGDSGNYSGAFQILFAQSDEVVKQAENDDSATAGQDVDVSNNAVRAFRNL